MCVCVGGGNSLTSNIIRSIRFFAASLTFALAALLFPLCGIGAPDAAALTPQTAAANDGFNDGIDRSDPNFVTASLLIMSPGDELYSCAGHACIRLECPTFNLDYCFSYESESVKEKVLTFFMGKLKMGMFAVPTAEYLKLYRETGRGVTQYRLNLPPDAKQRLWKNLDDETAKGPNQPYDYVKFGCAHSAFKFLQDACSPLSMKVLTWSERYKKTRRELLDDAIASYAWNRFFLGAIMGTEVDKDVSNIQKVVIPSDLVEFLRNARVKGQLVIDSPGVELLPQAPSSPAPKIKPLAVSWFIFVLTIANGVMNWRVLDLLFLACQTLAGAFFTYLVFLSDLPATSWNWLIVPFNLLPALLWKWRRKWALWFAAALVLWECGMIFYPHRLTDPAYLVLVAAFVLMYVRIGCPWRVSRNGFGRVGFGSGRDASTLRPPTV